MTATIRRRVLLVAVIVPALVAGCSGGSDGTASPSTTTSVVVRPPTTVAVDDGVLRIGALLPRTGAGARFGEPLVQAVQMAVAEVNTAGGVNGHPVELIVADEGDTRAVATKAATDLIDAGVDAVVGPASSRLALAVLGPLVDAGVFTCSPTATALLLSEFPDERLFVRTIPSDALEAMAMAEVIEGAGVRTASVMAPDDGFGRRYVNALVAALSKRGIAVAEQVLYRESDDQYVGNVASALQGGPGAVALVGNNVTGRQVLSTLDEAVGKGFPVVVNDALRRATAVDAGPPTAGNADITGTSPRASAATWFTSAFATFLGVDPSEVPVSFAANAYDCVSLLTVAASLARTNTAAGILQNVRDASAGGASCGNFATCQDFIAQGRNIDLNGASGPLELDTTGDVAVGWFDRFTFDQEGRDVSTSDFLVSG